MVERSGQDGAGAAAAPKPSSSGGDRARRFLDAFARIENRLADDAGDGDRHRDFSQLVNGSERLSAAQRGELKAVARLRNSIVHAAYFGGEPIADPREELVGWIEQQAELIEAPPRVLAVLGAQRVRALDERDPVTAFFELLHEHGYSQAPVRLASGGLGLITTNALARWLAAEFRANDGIAEAATVGDVLRLGERRDRAVLRERGLRAAEAVRILAGELGHPPAAIILTEHGRAEESPLAICTLADLPALLLALGVAETAPAALEGRSAEARPRDSA